MRQFLRVMIILIMPALLWAGWRVSPDLVSIASMRYLGAVFTLVWGIALFFLTKTADLSTLPGLSGHEHERLVLKLAHIRKRVWWIGGIALISAFLVWLIGSLPDLAQSAIAPISVGFLVGVGLSHLIVLPGWFAELYAFTDTIRLRNERNKRTELALKQISDGKKNHPSKAITSQ